MLVMRLPVELLTRIFVQCMPDEPYLEPNRAEVPLLLTQVCRHWRVLVLQTAELWCSLSAIQEEGWGGRLEPMHMKRMKGYAAWLSRSGNHPLSLAIPFDVSEQRSEEWQEIILGYRTRFRRLRVVNESGMDHNKLVDGAHMLRVLAIQARHERDHNLTVAIAQVPPTLHTLVLDGLYGGPATLSGPGWANLTHLAVKLPREESYQVDEFLNLVSRCPNLHRLIFGRFRIDGPNTPPPRSTHSNLRWLTIILDESDELDRPLCLLAVPNLFSLRVEREFRHDVEDELTGNGPTAIMPPGRYFNIKVGGNEGFQLFDVCWTNMTNLEVTFTGGLDVLRTMLGVCTTLEVLILSGRHCGVASTSLPNPLAHPTLSELYIRVDGPLGNFVQIATFPKLKHLYIVAASCGPHEHFHAFIARSSCPLQSLDVSTGRDSDAGATWTEEERDGLLALMPALTLLKLRPSDF